MAGELGKIWEMFRRELLSTRKNTLILLLILILPVSLGLMFGTFKEIVPTGAPAIVVPENANTTQHDLEYINSISSFFSKPTIEQAPDFNKLYREEAYYIIEVPPGTSVQIKRLEIFVDASMSPVAEIADPYVKEIFLYEFENRWNVHGIEINIHKVGRKVMPFEYFVPGVIITLLAIVGLIVIPFATSKDADVFRRLSTMTRIESIAASKIMFALALAFFQIFLLLATQVFAGSRGSDAVNAITSMFTLNFSPMGDLLANTQQYALINVSPGTILVMLLSAIFFTAAGLAITFWTRFSEAGKQANALLFGGVVLFSGAFYPIGFFPALPAQQIFGWMFEPVRGWLLSWVPTFFQSISRVFPSYYATIALRGFGVRNLAFGVLQDYVLIIAVSALIALGILYYSIVRLRNE
ncbi:ABC-2 family transporter protein [Candidatus Gugararchaeum adminiculabundum]|nr:ABC-2 family transporter protein [Candidatus Gugararchaeum adminiculabundum]